MEVIDMYLPQKKNKADYILSPTFASAAGLTFPKAKNAPPNTTILFTLFAKDESLFTA